VIEIKFVLGILEKLGSFLFSFFEVTMSFKDFLSSSHIFNSFLVISVKHIDRISNILNNELCCFDGAKMMSNALNKYCNQCIDLRNDNEINYQGFRNSKALAGFDILVRFVNSAHSKYLHLEIREKKAKLEKERVEFLQHRLEMEFQKYAVNN
jgi:hypothetical protein